MKPLKICFAFAIHFLFSTQIGAAPIGIDILSETHSISGSAGYDTNVSYDLTEDDPVSFSADGSTVYYGDDHSEATAGDFGVYTAAVGTSSYAVAESTYVFNIDSSELTLHTQGYSSSWGFPDDAQSSIKLTDLSISQELLFESNIYQPTPDEYQWMGAGSFYSFDDIYELTLNSDHTYELVLRSLSYTGQGGIYESSLLTEMYSSNDPVATIASAATYNSVATVPEPSALLLVAAGLTGAGFFRRKQKKRQTL